MRSLRPLGHVRLVATVTLFAVAALVAVQLACDRAGVAFGDLSRDAAAVARQPFYVGVLSNFGLVLWGAAIACGLLGWAVLRSCPGQREAALALAGFAAVSALLCADDNLQIHEYFLPQVLGLRERYAYELYLLCAAAWALRFRRVLLERVPVPLAVAGLGFGLSIASDLVSDNFEKLLVVPYLVEDGTKLVGILNWMLAGGALASAAISDARAPAAAQPPLGSMQIGGRPPLPAVSAGRT